MNDVTPGIGHNKPPTTAALLAEKYASLLAAIEPLAELADDLPAEFTTPDHVIATADIMKAARRALKEFDEARDKEGRPHLEAKREIDDWFTGRMARLKQSKKGDAPGLMDILQGRADAYQKKVDDAARKKAEENRLKAVEAEREQRRLAQVAEAENRKIAANAHAEVAGAAAVQADTAAASAAAHPAELTRVRSEGGAVASASAQVTFEVKNYAAVDVEALKPYLKHEWIDTAIKRWIQVNGEKAELGGVRVFREVRAVFR